MNIGLGFLVEVVAFVAAAYVVVALRPRFPRAMTDVMLASIGCVMGAGALLFQQDVSLLGGVLAPPLAALLLVAHVRVWDAVGVTLPEWVNIPPLGRGRAYASDPIQSPTIEEPMQQPNSTTQPEPVSGFDPEPLPDPEAFPEPFPGEEEVAAAPAFEPIPAEGAWPSTIVRAPAQTRLPRRGIRRTRVEIRRICPVSVLKFSLIFYFCVFLVIYLALAIIWAILSASGVIDSLEQLLGTIFPSGASLTPTGQVSTRRATPIQIDSGQVFTWLFFAGCVGVAVWSFINVFVAVMYNLISDIVGGVEVTLADRRD
ncbi:MAG TPA: DUF3566 domain-containing protein [Actinomycetota bacterium]|nr:DUF3566 domain-containing protein [Actinomycetota bacterium]